MHCPEREHLWDTYDTALQAFSIAASHLYDLSQTASGIRSQNELNMHFNVCHEANQRFMAAKANWERHIEEHGCDQS